MTVARQGKSEQAGLCLSADKLLDRDMGEASPKLSNSVPLTEDILIRFSITEEVPFLCLTISPIRVSSSPSRASRGAAALVLMEKDILAVQEDKVGLGQTNLKGGSSDVNEITGSQKGKNMNQNLKC